MKIIGFNPNWLILPSNPGHSKIKLINCKITKNNCWEVISHKPNKRGYIQLTRRIKGKVRGYSLHRLMYMKIIKKNLRKLCVCHICDNRKCINPQHLFLGTRTDNHKDMIRKGRNVSLRGEQHGYSKLTERKVNCEPMDVILARVRTQKPIKATDEVRVKYGCIIPCDACMCMKIGYETDQKKYS